MGLAAKVNGKGELFSLLAEEIGPALTADDSAIQIQTILILMKLSALEQLLCSQC